MRKLLGVGVIVVAALAGSCVGYLVVAQDAADPLTSIAAADALFDRWAVAFDFDAYEVSLRDAIDLWELALIDLEETNVQSRAHVLNHLAQGYFELAAGYLTDNGEKEAAFGAGKDAALASLRLDPTFDETEASDGFRAALLSATDVAAIFWYGNALGQWLNYHQLTAMMGGVRDVAASFERSLELNENYSEAGPHRAMGSLIAEAYFVIGRDRSEAVANLERCIELAPNHLEARVIYAEKYARPTGDMALFDTLIADVLVLAEDPTVVASFPFYNTLSIDRALALSSEE